MTWIGRKLTAGADQQHIRRLAQTCELAFIIEDDGLDTGALGNEPQEPRLAATRISLNEKARVDQRRKVELSFLPPTICPMIIAIPSQPPAPLLPTHY
jgi:hypothetical protein